MELQSDSTEQIYVRPKSNIKPYGIGDCIWRLSTSLPWELKREEPVTNRITSSRCWAARGQAMSSATCCFRRRREFLGCADCAVSRLFAWTCWCPDTGGRSSVSINRKEWPSSICSAREAVSSRSCYCSPVCLHARVRGVVDEPDGTSARIPPDTIFAELRKAQRKRTAS